MAAGQLGTPRPAHRRRIDAEYVYELAFPQFEIPDTRVSDQPATRRVFSEQGIHRPWLAAA